MITLPMVLYDHNDCGVWSGVVSVTTLRMLPLVVRYVWGHHRTVVEIHIAPDGAVVFVYEERRRAVPVKLV